VTAHLLSTRDDLSWHSTTFSQRVLTAVAFGILLVVAALVIYNGTSVEARPAHFPARVSH